MIYMRRIPGIIYRKKCFVFCALAILVSSIVLLLHWGILCTNIQAWHHVSYLCELYRQGKAIGSLCSAMCVDKQFQTLTCHPFHAGKDAVFSASWMIQGTPRAVFKAARLPLDGENDYLSENKVYTIDKDGNRKYPSEKEFEAMVADLVSKKLNISVTQEKLRKLGYLGPSALEGLPGTPIEKRKREMEAAWYLLQGHEYLVSILFEEREIFPKVMGTCGPYFASEWVDPLVWEESKEEWINRVHAAVLVLELIEALENAVPAFQLCDVRPGDFGITNDGSKAKVLDSDLALPIAVADKLTGDGKPCTKDEDCHYFDCKSRCLKGFCSEPVLNSNLQAFQGWGRASATA
ncbi:divergent protein kinase domain 1C isoform X2 [Ischnura elegans]|uniref:divergent protein kinase domain 1C isoform X2 n=1 Tax=Ischnura elegans TaxID=197161 RepID=UPI001ED87091|nr:divergent protein kinase domain 1C isoform X2 [Ischnura elegans]